MVILTYLYLTIEMLRYQKEPHRHINQLLKFGEIGNYYLRIVAKIPIKINMVKWKYGLYGRNYTVATLSTLF